MIRLAAMMMMAAAPVAAQPAMPGVPNPAQARVDYMLKCQGCHQPDGAGNAVNTPPLAGMVARFLAVPGGRQFVARVPGVAMVDLDSVRLAQLLNWTLYRFDARHVPAGFTPYTPAEIAALRRRPLRLDRVGARATLMTHIEATR
jgi:hypothetical protein